MTTQWMFTGLVFLVAFQRLLELRLSKRNEAALRGRGATEHAARQMPFMKALHAAWLASMLLEVWWLERPYMGSLALLGLVLTTSGQLLRYAAIRALGPRWSVRVLTVPGERAVTAGIYRYLQHPNYVGVVLEIAGVPLLHSAWGTTIVFSLLNVAILRFRLRAEEDALSATLGYREAVLGPGGARRV
jgi:methyltransferase